MTLTADGSPVRFVFEAEVIDWRGPSPFFFVPLPASQAEVVRRLARLVSYGWGMIPVSATIGGLAFRTSLFPKGETYLLPLKAEVRRRTGVTEGDTVGVEMTLQAARR